MISSFLGQRSFHPSAAAWSDPRPSEAHCIVRRANTSTGPVKTLTPHLLRHSCASELYGSGVSLYAIQQLLGHRWLSTTMGYVRVSSERVEEEYRKAAERAASRFGKE